jgi:enoyl-CoA hydratase/carnithine racemase
MPKATVSHDGGLAEIIIDAPPLNLFDAAMVRDLEVAIAEVVRLVETRDARALLIRAEGKVFCAGVDVHEFQDLSTAEGSALMGRFLTLVQSVEALPIPTVAVVHALNLTIGFELSLACDLMWAAEDASFGLVEATVGLTPGGGGTQRLVVRAGVARAAELVLTGDIYPASELHAWGVVNRLAPRETLLVQAREYAGRLAAGPTAAAAIGKRLLLAARDQGVTAADAMTAYQTGLVFATRDLPAGITSLLEHGPRQAVFEGR